MSSLSEWHVALQTCGMGLQVESCQGWIAAAKVVKTVFQMLAIAAYFLARIACIVFRLEKCGHQSRPGFWQAGHIYAKSREGPQRSALHVCISVLPTGNRPADPVCRLCVHHLSGVTALCR